MGETARFQETLLRLAIIDEGFVHDEAMLRLEPAPASALGPKTAALLQVGGSVAIGSPAACLGWATSRALVAGASEDEIADVLLAIIPVTGLGRVVAAAPHVATALGYDIEAALEQPDDHWQPPAEHINPAGRPAHKHPRRLKMNGPGSGPAPSATSERALDTNREGSRHGRP